MNCKSLRAAIIELAATGGEPISQLRAHLHECPSCRATLERERNLFAAIDAGLDRGARVELPPSFLPRVRARIAESPLYSPQASLLRKITLALAAAAVLLLSVSSLRHPQQPKSTPEASGQALPSSSSGQTLATSIQPPSAEIGKKAVLQPASSHLQHSILTQHGPEILVGPDQEALLAQYAKQLNTRRSAGAVAAVQSTPPDSQPLEIALIQIAELDVKPLAEQFE
jgi:hypothetical protein